jgi:hypothetical protein
VWWFCHVGKVAKGFEAVDGTWRGRKYLWRKLVVVGSSWLEAQNIFARLGKQIAKIFETAVMVT